MEGAAGGECEAVTGPVTERAKAGLCEVADLIERVAGYDGRVRSLRRGRTLPMLGGVPAMEEVEAQEIVARRCDSP